MQDKQAIAFTTTVTERDWDMELSGWRCPALKIPGAKVKSVFVSGNRVDSSWYEVNEELNIVRWVRSEPPPQAILLIKLTEELSTKELTLRWQKLAIILPLMASVAAALIAGAFSKFHSVGPNPPDNSNVVSRPSTCFEDVKITAPIDRQKVNISEMVMGTYKNLQQGQAIWTVVYSSDVGLYYPQHLVEYLGSNRWSSAVSIGVNGDKGKTFYIYAVLADEEAQPELNDYATQAKMRNDSPGWKDLPKGVRICSRITVIRN